MVRSEQQILITGCYRSGTEYITLLLNNHPKLSASMYVVSFLRFCYDRYNPVEVESNYKRLLEDAAQRIRTRYGRELHVEKIIAYCGKTKAVTYSLLYDLMMADLFLSDNVRRWAEKVQLVWTKIPVFLKMFPAGKVIHIVRDPRSVLASFKKITYAPKPGYLGAIFNCFDSMKKGVQYKKEHDPNCYYLLKYEDLIASPKANVIALFNFLGLSSDHDLLSEEGWKDPSGKPWSHNSAFAGENQQQHQFDVKASVDRWKENLAPWEISTCETINSDLMRHYGYEMSGTPAASEDLLRSQFSTDQLARYFSRWQTKREGVEEFPTDPLNPANWTENAMEQKR